MGKILRLNENFKFEEIETKGNEVSGEDLSNAIGGYFERVTFNRRLCDAKINVFVDEEGKIKELPLTVAVLDGKRIVELLAGPLVFTGMDDPNTPSLKQSQIDIIKEELGGFALLNIGGIPVPVSTMRYN